MLESFISDDGMKQNGVVDVSSIGKCPPFLSNGILTVVHR